MSKNTPTILALDTTTDLCSAALSVGGQVYARKVAMPREHAKQILTLIDSLFEETGLALKDCDAIAFGAGPGSFTGIRIATSIAQGLGFGADVPLIPICTLRAMAWAAFQSMGHKHVMAALDARQNEVYWGLYEYDAKTLMKPLEDVIVAPVAELKLPKKLTQWVGVGNGFKAYLGDFVALTGDLEVPFFEDILPEAQFIAELAVVDAQLKLMVSASEALPLYVRHQVVGR